MLSPLSFSVEALFCCRLGFSLITPVDNRFFHVGAVHFRPIAKSSFGHQQGCRSIQPLRGLFPLYSHSTPIRQKYHFVRERLAAFASSSNPSKCPKVVYQTQHT